MDKSLRPRPPGGPAPSTARPRRARPAAARSDVPAADPSDADGWSLLRHLHTRAGHPCWQRRRALEQLRRLHEDAGAYVRLRTRPHCHRQRQAYTFWLLTQGGTLTAPVQST